MVMMQAFGGFINRLSTVVFENALVIQGNRCRRRPNSCPCRCVLGQRGYAGLCPSLLLAMPQSDGQFFSTCSACLLLTHL